MKDPFNILVAGVGGQGNLVCGKILAEATVREGLRPVVGDTFGASQRGGSVLTHLRIGTQDWGPLIPRGEVDLLIGLEPLEALRAALDFAGKRTVAIISNIEIPAADVSAGRGEHPSLEKISNSLKDLCREVHILDSETILNRIGSSRVLNAYMLGAMAALVETPVSLKVLRATLERILGSDPNNLTAFDEGSKISH